MSTAAAAVRFDADGLVMWTTFNATAMILNTPLHPYWDRAEIDALPRAECTCGRAEPAEAWACYGGEFYWPVMACRHCCAVTTNLEYGEAPEMFYGTPAWVPSPWPTKPETMR
jgi:hypothetical protein